MAEVAHSEVAEYILKFPKAKNNQCKNCGTHFSYWLPDFIMKEMMKLIEILKNKEPHTDKNVFESDTDTPGSDAENTNNMQPTNDLPLVGSCGNVCSQCKESHCTNG